MTQSDLFACPGSRPEMLGVPETHPCPECGHPVEIWTDENTGKCSACGSRMKAPGQHNSLFQSVVEAALVRGATEAVILRPDEVAVDPALAEKCLAPRCEFYGLSKSCPPNVSGPKAFTEKLAKTKAALFFRIDLPKDLLFSSDRRECFQLLHEVAAGIEMAVVSLGFQGASAYAGGSCKNIFCDAKARCRVVDEKKPCRHPHKARPSMSGFGIHVAKLMEAAGWKDADQSGKEEMSYVCGLVLLAQ